MPKSSLFVGLLGSFFAIALSFSAHSSELQEVVECRSMNPEFHAIYRFETADLSKMAKVELHGPALYEGLDVPGESCDGFTMRGRKYYNTYTIHTLGCRRWSCSLHAPDTIHGYELFGFQARLECHIPVFPVPDARQIPMICDARIERAQNR